MDLQTALKVDGERQRREREEQAAADVAYRERQKKYAASREQQADASHKSRLGECERVVQALETTVEALAKVGYDALYRAVGSANVLHDAEQAMLLARERLVRLKANRE